MHWGDLDEKEVKGRGYVFITADSLCSTVETNATLYSNYAPIKINLKKTKLQVTWNFPL